MDKLSLHIILAGSLARLLQELSDVEAPEFVAVNIETLPEGIPIGCAISDDFDTILITSEIDHVASMVDAHYVRATAVYVGDCGSIEDSFATIPAVIEDMWTGDRTAAYYRHRFSHMLWTLKYRFDAWLYRTWLYMLAQTIPDLVWFKDKEGLHNYVNQTFCATTRKSFEQIKDRGHSYIWNAPPESEYQCAETDNAVMSSGKTVVADEKVETDRGLRQYRTYKSPIRGRDGQIIGTVGVAHDVTDFTNMGMELQILMGNLPYPVALADTDWRLISSNDQYREAFGLTEEEVRSLDYRAWRDSFETEVVERVAANGDRRTTRDLISDRAGERRVYEVSEPDIIDYFDNVSGHYCLFRDVTVERSYERQVTMFATTDSLTGLANRRRIDAYLTENVGEPMCLLMFDLDNFKDVNDTFGHLKGDEVLVRFAYMLKDMFPEGLVARQGGDEFACALKGMWDEDELQERVRRLYESIEKEFGSLGVGFGCSVGMAMTDALPEDAEALARQADNLMYAQKEQHHRDVPKG